MSGAFVRGYVSILELWPLGLGLLQRRGAVGCLFAVSSTVLSFSYRLRHLEQYVCKVQEYVCTSVFDNRFLAEDGVRFSPSDATVFARGQSLPPFRPLSLIRRVPVWYLINARFVSAPKNSALQGVLSAVEDTHSLCQNCLQENQSSDVLN